MRKVDRSPESFVEIKGSGLVHWTWDKGCGSFAVPSFHPLCSLTLLLAAFRLPP